MSMSEARELFDAGNLEGAIEACGNAVKQKPVDQSARGFLAELLSFAGELERADKQLEVLLDQSPESAPGLALFRQLLRGAQARKEFYEQGRPPELLATADDTIKELLRASVSLRGGDTAAATESLRKAEESRGTLAGSHAGKAFDDMRDLDDRCAGIFEVLTGNGEYHWVPASAVLFVDPAPIKRARDLLWRPVQMAVRDGPEGQVYVPTIYYDAEGRGDGDHVLGRKTDWIEAPEGSVFGVGLRTFLIGDADTTLLEMSRIEIEQAQG